MPSRILVVEDDSDLRELIGMAASSRGFEVRTARNGLEAKADLEGGLVPDLVILDINMPGMDGFAFCRRLREELPVVPVIFLSARDEEYDKIVAFEIGGDDYLTKPFSMRELFARVEVSLRRVRDYRTHGAEAEAEIGTALAAGKLELDPARWKCRYAGREVVLTVSEFRILRKLAANPEIVVTRDELAQAAFPDDKYNSGRSIDTHVHRIRRKLKLIDDAFDSIQTVYQVGYSWRP